METSFNVSAMSWSKTTLSESTTTLLKVSVFSKANKQIGDRPTQVKQRNSGDGWKTGSVKQILRCIDEVKVGDILVDVVGVGKRHTPQTVWLYRCKLVKDAYLHMLGASQFPLKATYLMEAT